LHVSLLRSLVACKAAWRVPRLDWGWAGWHRGLATENCIQRRWFLSRSLEWVGISRQEELG
jgi:hypothetical protein